MQGAQGLQSSNQLGIPPTSREGERSPQVGLYDLGSVSSQAADVGSCSYAQYFPEGDAFATGPGSGPEAAVDCYAQYFPEGDAFATRSGSGPEAAVDCYA